MSGFFLEYISTLDLSKQNCIMKFFLTFIFFNLSTLLFAQELPAFSYITTAGDTISNKNLLGKSVYINIWETYCGPCIDEMPTLNELKEKFPNTVFLSITPAGKSKTLKFLKRHPISFQVIYGAGELVKKIYKGYYPTHIFINKEGKIHYLDNSAITITTIGKPTQKELDKLIGEENYKRLAKALGENEMQ